MIKPAECSSIGYYKKVRVVADRLEAYEKKVNVLVKISADIWASHIYEQIHLIKIFCFFYQAKFFIYLYNGRHMPLNVSTSVHAC